MKEQQLWTSDEWPIAAFVIHGSNDLDPVSVYIKNRGAGCGEITLTCCGQAWSHYWRRMGEQHSVESFFLNASTEYLAGKLYPGHLPRTVADYDALHTKAQQQILIDRRDNNISKDEARELWEEAENLMHIYDEHELRDNTETLERIFGEEWYDFLPERDHREMVYLRRIVDTVKDALRIEPTTQEQAA